MSPSTITLLFLLFAVIMFVMEKIPLGVTSMIVCLGLVVTGVLDVKMAFAGFIDSNVILFVAMFIVGGALFETGMANKIGAVVTKFARYGAEADHCNHGDRWSDERCAFQYGYSRCPDSGRDRYRSKIRIQKIPSFNAPGICCSYGWQPFPDRSAGKYDCPECLRAAGAEIQLF